MLAILNQRFDAAHLEQAQRHCAKAIDELAGKGLINPQQIAEAISDQATEDSSFTCDVGLPTRWAARYLAKNGKRWRSC